MAAALTRRPAFRRWKPDRGSDRDPAGVLAGDVVAVDQVERENLVRPVANAGLEPRPRDTGDIGRASLAEGFYGELQYVGEFPVPADAVEQIMAVDRAV